jgi:hypothetical protein
MHDTGYLFKRCELCLPGSFLTGDPAKNIGGQVSEKYEFVSQRSGKKHRTRATIAKLNKTDNHQ